MHTTATLHVHPAAANPYHIFEIRRLARECGCAFVTTKPKLKARTTPAPFDPNGGGARGMIKFKIDNRTLQLLNAQVNLTETFNHVLRTAPKRECLAFRLKVERGTTESTFVVELGSERHTLTLPNDKKTHLKLADFIEEIANGPFDARNTSELMHRPHASREYGRFEVSDKQRVFELVRTGGVLSLDMGFDYPLQVALHRTQSRSGVTTILSIGNTSPHTRCFTVYGSDVEIYGKVTESINHLAAAATPAAHAA